MTRANNLLRLTAAATISAAFIASCSTDWGAFRHNSLRTAAQLNASVLSDPAKVPSLAVKWRFPKTGDPDLGGAFRASPVIWKGKVYVGNGNGRFYALDANTGVKLWQFPAAASPALTSQFTCNPSSMGIASSAVIAAIGGTDAVIFAAPDQSIGTGLGEGRLFALNAATGALIWASPVIARVTGLTSQSKTQFHENLGYSAPIVSNGMVYVGVGDHCDNPIQKGRVAAVDLATGTIVGGFSYCSTGTCADTTRGGGVWSPIAVLGTAMYITTGNTKSGAATEPAPNRGLGLLRLDATTGAVAWLFQPVPWILDADPDWSAGPTIMFASCGSRVVSTMKDGWTHALDDAGARQWTYPPATIPFTMGDGTAHMDTRYMRSGAAWGDVYITMNGGMNVTTNVTAGYKRLHAFNVCSAAADRVRWLIDVPGASGNTYSLGPPTVTRGIVYVGTDLGHVVAIADPSLVPPAGYRCINPDVTTASCVASGYTLVPQPAVLADVTVTGSMVYTEPALANGKVYVSTGGFGNVGYVYMLSP